MADITVTCTNDKNVSIAFRWDWDNNPFHLLGLDGIYGYDCNVTTSENTTTDGSTYQGSTAKERNIVITAEIDGDYRKNRELLYRVFPKGRTGTLEYSEDGDIKIITYRVESVTPGATTGVVRDYTISLICTDPYFKDLSDVEVVMASWVSDWYFENGFDINGVEFGHREAELVKEIENNNGADNIGITAIFRADGIVKNPAIYHSESGKYIKVGYAGNDFELQSGQYVVIFTHTGIGFKGIVKKIMVFVVIAVAYNVQRMTGDTIPLREIVIVFFICNEALSVLENAAEFINIPQQLKDVLLQLRDKNAAKAEEKEESEE